MAGLDPAIHHFENDLWGVVASNPDWRDPYDEIVR
jgi:hypothetical protein